MTKRINVFIGIPCADKIDAEPAYYCFPNLLRQFPPDGEIGLYFRPWFGSLISYSRNGLVKEAKESGASHLLFIDTDIVYPANALHRLLAWDKDIVCASYPLRGDPINSEDAGKPLGKIITKHKDLNLMEFAPTGFMLIKMHVFDKVGSPAFYEPPNPESNNVLGEDYNFCLLARKAGFEIWMDKALTLELEHIGKKSFMVDSRLV